MNPGEKRGFTDRYITLPAHSPKNGHYEDEEPIAAIYADGRAFGDTALIKEMMQQRRYAIDALTNIGTTLCRMGMQQTSKNDIAAALDKQRAEEDARSRAGSGALDLEYSFVGKMMVSRVVNHMTPSQGLKYMWDQVDKRRSALAVDPVKGDSGQPNVLTFTPLPCNLPK
jgi:hypothetical protein